MLTKNFWKAFAALFTGNSKSFELTSYSNDKETEYVFYNNAPSAEGIGMLTARSVCKYAASLAKIAYGYGSQGTAFGDGTAEPTLDDYKLSGNFVTTITGTSAESVGEDENGASITSIFTLTNTGTEPITISEVGRFGGFRAHLVERVLLETPVTIPAGGVGQVTFTTRFDYPW